MTHFPQIELFPAPAIPDINVILSNLFNLSFIKFSSDKYYNPALKILGLLYLATAILATYYCIVNGIISGYFCTCVKLNLFQSDTPKEATVKKYITLS